VPQAVLDLQGLTEEEAAARKLEGQDNTVHFKPPYTTRQIWRANTLTIFNLSMVGLAVVQILLGKPLDALLTTGVMFLGIGLNAGQQLWARGRLKALEQTTRAQATVVREGMVRSIDPGEVVQGDVLVVGPGDQMLADGQVLGTGQLVVDESMLTGDPRQHTRQAGQAVYAGSFCLAGHGAYEAQKVGSERLIAALTGEFQAVDEELTPLERTMDRLLRILLVIVAVLSLLLLADYFDLLLPGIHMDAFASAASVIFGIAPSSLFLMILVNYAMGTADLARVGALVHRSRSVESLAQATVICFAQAGILTGMDLEMEPVEAPRLAASRIRQILGAYARSTSASSPAVRAIAAAFPGGRRRVQEEAPFLSLYGWSAVAFDDEDLRGVYVLGDPDLLGEHMVSDEPQPEDAGEERPVLIAWRERMEGLWRAVRPSTETTPRESSAQQEAQEQSSPTAVPQEATAVGGLMRRLSRQVDQVLGREEGSLESSEQDVQPIEEAVYMVAYCPEPVPLHTEDGMPILPEGLLPLCRLRYTEQVRPEAVETVRAFSQSGVELKVLTQDAPERTLAVLRQAGLGRDDGTPLHAVSGPELATLDRERFERAAVENTIFGTMSPRLESQVVDALRAQGESVAVVGDGVNDLPAMQQANLSITQQSSSPAALSVADIILLEDSSQALLRVLDKGQRIANGLLDILKLYLNQIAYLTLLILVIWGAGLGFPYLSKQASLITIVSVILPSLALSLWAPAGVVPRTHLGRLLARFVAPAAVTVSVAAVAVYIIFLEMSGEVAYAQLAVTYTLVISGLVLVVLLRPPVRGLTPVGMGDERSGDWRPTVMVMVLLILVFVVASIPLADNLFGLKPLQQPTDYLVVGLAVLAWALTASLIWRVSALWTRWRGVEDL
jgi:magnesium-transporting ATPase (P-type)